jgi:hypothetical protein
MEQCNRFLSKTRAKPVSFLVSRRKSVPNPTEGRDSREADLADWVRAETPVLETLISLSGSQIVNGIQGITLDQLFEDPG